MRKTILSMIIAAAVGSASLAFAAPGGPGMGGPGMGHGHGDHGMMALHDLDKLNLTDAQRTSIKQISKQGFEQLKPQMESLHQQHDAFDSMEPTSSGYQTAAGNLATAEANLVRARVMQDATLRAQVYNILTPSQRSQLVTMHAQRQARMQQWKEFQAQHPLPPDGSSAQ